MTLSQAEFLAPPGGPGGVGGVKAGNNTVISPQGAVSFFGGSTTQVTKISTNSPAQIAINPSSGVGNVTVSYIGPTLETPVGAGDDDFPSGTKMPFFQPSAPTGWFSTGTDNYALRIVSGNGGGTGGNRGFTEVHTNYNPSGRGNANASVSGNTNETDVIPTGINRVPGGRTFSNVTLGISEMGAHIHNLIASDNHKADNTGYCFTGTQPGQCGLSVYDRNTTDDCSGQSHTHTLVGNVLLFNGSGGRHSHSFNISGNASGDFSSNSSFNFNVRYCNFLLCQKN